MAFRAAARAVAASPSGWAIFCSATGATRMIRIVIGRNAAPAWIAE